MAQWGCGRPWAAIAVENDADASFPAARLRAFLEDIGFLQNSSFSLFGTAMGREAGCGDGSFLLGKESPRESAYADKRILIVRLRRSCRGCRSSECAVLAAESVEAGSNSDHDADNGMDNADETADERSGKTKGCC